MKKPLATEGIRNELAHSVFFQKREGEPPNDPTRARSNARTGERVITPPPEPVNARTPEGANEHTPERVTLPSPVQPSPRSPARLNARTVQAALLEKTERYSFEIYPSQQERIEEYLYQHKRKTKQKISASHFIRTAIDYYFQTLP